MLVTNRLASSGPSLSKLHSLKISWIVRSWLWFFFPSLQLTGPIQVIHQAKACCDVKGGKNELSFKQGENIEIIRITDNPEGKWLGRTAADERAGVAGLSWRVSGWWKMAGQNSQGVMWVHIFLRLQSVFFWANLNVKILPKLVISIKLGVCYRVDKNRKILNDKHSSIFTSFVQYF